MKNGSDAFLSYHSADYGDVERIRQLLESRGISTFLDRKNLVPGVPWPGELENALKQSRAVVVFLGEKLGFWQEREINYALERQKQERDEGRSFLVIPVLLKRGESPPLSFLTLNTWVDLSSGANDTEAIGALERAIKGTGEDEPLKLANKICPFIGLKTFREEDASFFFGRGKESCELLKQISVHKIVTLIGASGSGKSSLIQAGLLPLLRRQQPPDNIWDVVYFHPEDRPFRQLATAIAPFLYPDLKDIDLQPKAMKLAEIFRKAPEEVEITLRACLDRLHWTDRLLVIVDQFEQLLTPAAKSECERFLSSILQAQERLPLTLLFGLRADCYDRAIGLDGDFAKRLLSAPMALYAMTREELAEAIREPARQVKLEFEPGLVEQILDDAGREPGSLPLIEFTLRSLWQDRDKNRLTHQSYRKIGKVTGAIAEAADRIFLGKPEVDQELVRRLFTRLVRIESFEDGRRYFSQRAQLGDLSKEEQEVAGQFATEEGKRLLVLGHSSIEETVALAHEALIQHWQRFGKWLDDDQELLLWRQRLQQSMEQWERAGRTEDALLPRNLLSQAEGWLSERPEGLAEKERRFIVESLAEGKRLQDQKEQRRRREIRTWRAVMAIAALFIILISAGWWTAIKEKRSATARYLAAQADGFLPTRQQTAVLLALEASRLTEKADQPRFPQIEGVLRQALLPFGGRALGTYRGFYRRVVASPDRTRIAALGSDNKVRLWNLNLRDPASGEKVFPGFQGEPLIFQISPANRWILYRARNLQLLRLQSMDDAGDVREILLPDRLLSMEISSDDRVLALQVQGDGVRLRNLTSPERPERRIDSSRNVTAMTFSPDGRQIATAVDDGTVHIWTLNGDAEPKVSPPCSPSCGETISALSFVPGTDSLVAVSASGDFWLWNGQPGAIDQGWRRVYGLRHGSLSSQDLRVSENGELLYVWVPKSNNFAFLKLSSSYPGASAFAGVGAFATMGNLISFAQGRAIKLFNVGSSTYAVLERRGGAVHAIEIRKCCLVAGGEDRFAHLWRSITETPRLDAVLGGHDDPVDVVGLGVDGRWLVTGGRQGVSPRLWDIEGDDPAFPGEPLRLHQPASWGGLFAADAPSLAFRGDRLLVLSSHGPVSSTFIGGEPVTWMDNPRTTVPSDPRADWWRGSFRSDGRQLATPTSDGRILVWDLDATSPSVHAELHAKEMITQVELDATGRWLAAGVAKNSSSINNDLVIWRLGDSIPKRFPHPGREGVITALVFSPDGRWLISCWQDGVAYIWSLETTPSQKPWTLETEGGRITAAASTGDWIALASEDRIVRLWRPSKDLKSKSLPDMQLEGAAETIFSLAFGPGPWLAGGGLDGTIYLWNWEQYPRTPIVLKKHRAPVRRMTFSPDGRWLLTADINGEIFRWRMEQRDLEAFACRTVGRNLSQKEWRDFFPDQKYRRTCPEWSAGI